MIAQVILCDQCSRPATNGRYLAVSRGARIAVLVELDKPASAVVWPDYAEYCSPGCMEKVLHRLLSEALGITVERP